jgi:hypothetical protein
MAEEEVTRSVWSAFLHSSHSAWPRPFHSTPSELLPPTSCKPCPGHMHALPAAPRPPCETASKLTAPASHRSEPCPKPALCCFPVSCPLCSSRQTPDLDINRDLSFIKFVTLFGGYDKLHSPSFLLQTENTTTSYRNIRSPASKPGNLEARGRPATVGHVLEVTHTNPRAQRSSRPVSSLASSSLDRPVFVPSRLYAFSLGGHIAAFAPARSCVPVIIKTAQSHVVASGRSDMPVGVRERTKASASPLASLHSTEFAHSRRGRSCQSAVCHMPTTRGIAYHTLPSPIKVPASRVHHLHKPPSGPPKTHAPV